MSDCGHSPFMMSIDEPVVPWGGTGSSSVRNRQFLGFEQAAPLLASH